MVAVAIVLAEDAFDSAHNFIVSFVGGAFELALVLIAAVTLASRNRFTTAVPLALCAVVLTVTLGVLVEFGPMDAVVLTAAVVVGFGAVLRLRGKHRREAALCAERRQRCP